MTKKVGRPRTYTEEQIKNIKERLSNYIDSSSVPIIAEFAYKNNIPRTVFYDYTEFSTLIKKLIDKKEAQLERGALSGVLNSTMAIFSLKQLGWRDKQDINIAGQEDPEPVKIKWK